MSAFEEMSAHQLVAALEAKGFTVTLDPPLGAGKGETSSSASGPSEEDIALCSAPSIPRTVPFDELIRLLTMFKDIANVRWPAKPEVVCVDKVVMALRGCTSVITKRQDDAVAGGIVPLLVDVLTGVHFEDRETCLRTVQCISGVANKNAGACAAFREAGAESALAAIIAKHSDKSTADMEAALETITSTV